MYIYIYIFLFIHLVTINKYVLFYTDGRKNFWKYIPGGLRDVVVGLLVGVALGFIFGFLPHRNAVTIYIFLLIRILVYIFRRNSSYCFNFKGNFKTLRKKLSTGLNEEYLW